MPAVENLPDSAIRRPRRTREEFKAALEAAKLLPARPVSRPVWEQLHELATNPYCATAGATLKDRTFLPRVVFEHVDEAVKWRAPFWRRFVRPDLVVDVTRSPNQIPTPYVYRIWAIWETSMGSLEFVVRLKSGEQFGCLYSGPSDLIALPEPFEPDQIVELEIGRGLTKTQTKVLGEPDYVWCVYSGEPIKFEGRDDPRGPAQ